jgi:hypothetical protein
VTIEMTRFDRMVNYVRRGIIEVLISE